jgi:hypothetical protein
MQPLSGSLGGRASSPKAPTPDATRTQFPPKGPTTRLLSSIAVILALAALVTSFVVPGPPGSQGTGPAGPPGPGTLINSTRSSFGPGPSLLFIVGCTNVHVVNLTVPSAGKVVMTSTVYGQIEHTMGTTDIWGLYPLASGTGCLFKDIGYIAELSGAAASDIGVNFGASVVRAFTVSAGTYAFSLHIDMLSGESPNDFVSGAETVVVFYPS